MTFLSLSRRRFMASAAALGALGAMPLAGSLPALAAAPAPATKGGTLRVSVDQAVSVINPLMVRVNPEYLVAELLYSGLTRLKPDMTAEADLAQSWQASDDLKTWTFTLRPNLVFTDGSPCTSKDVVASFQAILDPKTASPGRAGISAIEAVAADGDDKVVITLHGASADLPVILTYPNAKVVPAAIISGGLDRLSREAVGTGPFKLVSYEPDRQIVVTRNEHYYEPGRPHLDRVEVVVYPDQSAGTSALISGDIDLVYSTDAAEYQRYQNASGVVPLRVPSGQFLNINMGCDQKPFSDVRVRQALALAVDREALVGFIAQGFGTPGNDSPLNQAYPFYKEQPLKKPDYDKAKQLLAEAGFPNGVDLTLIASDKPGTRTQLGIAVREMATPAGFRINVQTMPHATYLDQVWKKGSFYVGFYNMQATADAIFSLLYTSDAAWNETRWNNKEFDGLIAEARTTSDGDKRKELYGQAQELMNKEVPSVIPVFFDLLAARRDYVEGYELHPRGAVFRLDYVSLGANAPKRG
ncbi:peptide/nickel transport system substrate-binding protein [Faunimonas pinastri]|uniref:Peptide/nickel transport system substrate-binding protein n=1 Tax=Faunimonas pinastri TaxID=1855383 RepID=A0A1H9M0W7_9HYPH|nr:ABC transporter substrate-binding protein [Faunimonas pinastri]SER17312.1 peptide/nickel transport system substrate-binding protein [Faunimonas pinastri]